MAISIRLSEQEDRLVRAYAKLHNLSVSDLVRQCVMERIEDEIDLRAWQEAHMAYEVDSTTYSHEEVCAMMLMED